MKDEEMKLVANHWLWLWSDCLRARQRVTCDVVRETSASYARGAPDAKEYRPADDPDPMFFVFAQVEQCLGKPGSLLHQFALHVWRYRRSPVDFTHPDLEGKSTTSLYTLKNKLLKKLGGQIISGYPERVDLEAARGRGAAERKRN